MINSRLYYYIKQLLQGILNFYYYTAEIDENDFDLKSYTKRINQEEVLFTLYNIGIKNMLHNINKAEFTRFLIEFKEHKDSIDNLSCTEPSVTNTAIAKLWGPNEFQRKFTEWFINNGYEIPNHK